MLRRLHGRCSSAPLAGGGSLSLYLFLSLNLLIILNEAFDVTLHIVLLESLGPIRGGRNSLVVDAFVWHWSVLLADIWQGLSTRVLIEGLLHNLGVVRLKLG